MNKLLFSFLILSLAACSGLHRISNSDLSWQYRDDPSWLKPQYAIVHESADSSTLYLRLPVADILYKRSDDGEMKADFSLRFIFFQSYESKKIVDSLSVSFSPPYSNDSNAIVIKSFGFRHPKQNCLLALRLNDLNRGSFKESFMDVDVSKQSAQDFDVRADNDNFPLFSNVLNNAFSNSLSVSDYEGTSKMWVRCFFKEYPVALPPFSTKPPQIFSYTSDSSYSVSADNNGKFNISPLRYGIYHLQFDTMIKSGATLFHFDESYPEVTSTNLLIEALRYLTTAGEYNELINAGDKKAAVDDFWIKVSGSKERARFLIRMFYSRMQNANRFFTSYLEGWKTDRGMIYLVFGPPKTVYRTSEAEYWDYGPYRGFGSLNFTFRKMSNPFTVNDFVLVRSASYEPVWYMAVDNWRQGRISGEDIHD